MADIEKRVALVTGANRGIGFEIARQLAQKKIKVLVGARDLEKGIEAAETLTKMGIDVQPVQLEVNQARSIEATVGKISDEIGRLDILINNAGIQIDTQSDILELDPVIFKNTLETNALGPLLLAQSCVPIMEKNGYGRIVNIASTLGSLAEIASPESAYEEVLVPAYRLSKTLLNGITVLLAKQLRNKNILVNSTCPGWVRTDMGGSEAPLTPDQGAETPVWLATLSDGGPTGGFFRERQPIPW